MAPSSTPFLPPGHLPHAQPRPIPIPSQSATAPRLQLEGQPPFTLSGQPGNGSYFSVSCSANSPTKTSPTRRPECRQPAERNLANSPNEIKLGGTALIDKGAPSLSARAAKLDPAKLPAPAFLMVLVADGDIAYRRPDGIIVCPQLSPGISWRFWWPPGNHTPATGFVPSVHAGAIGALDNPFFRLRPGNLLRTMDAVEKCQP